MVSVPPSIASHLPTNREVARWVDPVARVGYAAKGVVYAIVGALAVRAAMAEGEARDAAGALAWLRESAATDWMLTAIAIGLAAYVVWRLVQALVDPEHVGVDGKRIGVRMLRVVSAVIYGSLAVTAWRLAHGERAEGASEDRWTAELMSQPFGPWLVGALGAGIIAYGLYQLYRAWTADVEKHMRFGDEATRRRIVALARFGLAARGVVFGVVGWFFVQAGRRYDPSAAGGTDEALRALGNELLFGIVALGLVAYGLYQIAEARYRRIG